MTETPFRWSDADLGVLCNGATSGRTAVVWLNAGAIRRTGPFRLHVLAARHFATLGFPTLRLDQPGVADHIASARKPQIELLSDLLDRLQRETGCERFVVGGICSAADFAWQLALRDSRVAGLLLLDPMARREAPGFRLGQVQLVLRRGPMAWIDMVRRRLAKRTKPPQATDSELRDWPAPGTEAAQLSTLVGRGAELFVLYTGGAATYFTHPRQFHAGFGADSRSDRIRFAYWRHCDHLFFQPHDRERLVTDIGQWLQDRFGAGK